MIIYLLLLQCGGLYSGASDINIKDSTFSSNIATTQIGGALFYASYNVHIIGVTFFNNSAHQSVGGLLFQRVIGSSVVDCEFSGNDTDTTGGLGLQLSEDVFLSRNKFVSNNASEGYDGGVAVSLTKNVTVANCSFEGNEAISGAGIHIAATKYISVDASSFVDNVATAYGSAVFSKAGLHFSIFDSHFERNSALAGTVMWRTGFPIFTETEEAEGTMPEIIGLESESNTFTQNTALYGDKYATEGVTLVIVDDSSNSSSSSVYIDQYDSPVPNVNVALRDFYDQTVVTDSSNFVEASVSLADHGTCNGDDGYLTGDHIVKLDKGIATFSALEVFCFPEHSLNVSFGTDSQQAMTSTVYDFRPCVRRILC